MVKKKYRRVCGNLWRPIPGIPALYGKVNSRSLSSQKNRKSDMELDELRDRHMKRKKRR